MSCRQLSSLSCLHTLAILGRVQCVFSRVCPGLGVLVSPGWGPSIGTSEFGMCSSSPLLELGRLFSRLLCVTEPPPAVCERNHFVCSFQSFFVHVQANRHADFNSHPPTLIKRVYSAPSLSPLNRVISRFLFLIEEYHTFSFFSLTLHSVSLYKQNMPPIYGCWIVVIF